MGSFNATCIVSNLPIEAGTPVRFLAMTGSRFHRDGNDHICYVSGRWQLRCPPIRAEYNDYGSVQKLKEGLVHQVFFESLNRDCVEKGVGDNQCHDVQVRSGMTPGQWLEALWEGRVYVKDRDWDIPEDRERKAPELPKGMPTLARIEKVLQDNQLPVVTAYGAEGYVIDEVSPGFLRIRYGRHVEMDKREDHLRPVLPLLDAAGYAAMITCGTGNYRDPAEILVAPKPVPRGAKDDQGRDIYFFGRGLAEDDERNIPRPVTQAMIREDVWQIMLNMPIQSWQGAFTFADMRTAALQALDEELKSKAELESLKKESPEIWKMKSLMRSMGMDNRDNRFRMSLGEPEGVSGFSLKAAFSLAFELTGDRKKLEKFVLDMAETGYVQWQYAHLHGQWHPTTNSGQEGNWKEHRAFLEALSKIKGQWEDEDDE